MRSEKVGIRFKKLLSIQHFSTTFQYFKEIFLLGYRILDNNIWTDTLDDQKQQYTIGTTFNLAYVKKIRIIRLDTL